MMFNHLYKEAQGNICPITGELISYDFTLPAGENAPYGFAYKINSINPNTVVIIPDSIMTNSKARQLLLKNADRFRAILEQYKEPVYWVH